MKGENTTIDRILQISTNFSSTPPQESQQEILANFVWRVASILLVLFGSLGNALSFMVMSRPTIRKSVTSLLLRILSVVDTSVLWTGYFVDWILIIFNYDLRLLSEFGCRFQHVMFYWTFHYSAWILVLVTTERYISVVFPLKAKKIITKKSMLVALVIIGILLFMLSAHFFWTQKLATVDGAISCINDVDGYDFWLTGLWPWIDLTIYSIIPFLLICACNIAIMWRVLLSRKKSSGGNPSASSTKPSSEKSSQMTSMTTTLVCVSVVFLVTTLPYPFYVLVQTYAPNSDIDINTHGKEALGWAMVNFAAYLNNAVNFPLYCLSSRLFRGELTAMMCKTKVGPAANTQSRET